MMKYWIIIFAGLVVSSNYGQARKLPPYIVTIHSNGEHICSGVLYTKKHVLTVASCVCHKHVKRNSDNLFIHIGPSLNQTSQIRQPSRVYCHSDWVDYHPFGSINDISVIKLKEKASIASNQLIGNAQKKFDPKVPCELNVWRNGKLDLVEDIILEDNDYAFLRKIKDKRIAKFQLYSTKPQFEVESVDRGSPLICGGKLQGLISYWYPYKTTNIKRYVYTNIHVHNDYLLYVSDQSE